MEAYKDLPDDARIKVDVSLTGSGMSITDAVGIDILDLFDLKIEVDKLMKLQRQNLRSYKHVDDVCEYARKTIKECKKWLEKYEKYAIDDDEEEQEKCTFNDVVKFSKNDIEQFGVVENRTDDIIYVVDNNGKQHLITDKNVLEIMS